MRHELRFRALRYQPHYVDLYFMKPPVHYVQGSRAERFLSLRYEAVSGLEKERVRKILAWQIAAVRAIASEQQRLAREFASAGRLQPVPWYMNMVSANTSVADITYAIEVGIEVRPDSLLVHAVLVSQHRGRQRIDPLAALGLV